MSTESDWRTALAATERFANIQKMLVLNLEHYITTSGDVMLTDDGCREASVQIQSTTGSAFTLENDAYLSSSSRVRSSPTSCLSLEQKC